MWNVTLEAKVTNFNVAGLTQPRYHFPNLFYAIVMASSVKPSKVNSVLGVTDSDPVACGSNEVGWLCLTSHRQRGHLETAPPFTVPCEGGEAR